ncbi:hypothetical protein [Paenibacillus glycinis]|uniref:ABC transporter permease n=1 Tax=Paenibacillus glycinis TaxID=2697035 RepID=A0ABW9XN16_9BACL|nr:hypothetical protein [Paenibacillus glycinis]NBD23913.1 hypothetical protein [Paenibacillus glycinis]
MSTWQGALTLLRSEGRRSWGGLLLTMVFSAYISVVMMPLFQNLLDHGGKGVYGWIGNFLYMTLLPNMAFILNRSVFHYWSRDPYSRRLAYWRTLPISWNAIVLSRMLQLCIVLTIVSVFFFTVQYALLNELRELMAPSEYIVYALVWYGYALTLGATYAFFEQTLGGKAYLAVCHGYLIFYLLIGVVLWRTDTDLLYRTIEASRAHEWAWPVVSLLLGAAATVLIGLLIRKQLAKRNFYH